jgi:hypothetical protein
MIIQIDIQLSHGGLRHNDDDNECFHMEDLDDHQDSKLMLSPL